MKQGHHTHRYETVLRSGISHELMELGIQSAEIRRCKQCNKEMPFVMTRKGNWVSLFEETERDEQDILLA